MGSLLRSEPKPGRPERARERITGTVRNIRHDRIGGMPALEAELHPAGRSKIELVWLGRRNIHGIHPGRRIVVRGRVARIKGERTIYNPAYELQPVPAGAAGAEPDDPS